MSDQAGVDSLALRADRHQPVAGVASEVFLGVAMTCWFVALAVRTGRRR